MRTVKFEPTLWNAGAMLWPLKATTVAEGAIVDMSVSKLFLAWITCV